MDKINVKDLPISEIMQKKVITLNTEDTVDKATKIFKDHSFHHIPVVDQENNIVGIISTTDLERISLGMSLFKASKKEEYNKTLHRSLRVLDIMSKEMVIISEHETIEDAYKIFWNGIVRCLPVVKNGAIVGIVSPLDIIDYLLNNTKLTHNL